MAWAGKVERPSLTTLGYRGSTTLTPLHDAPESISLWLIGWTVLLGQAACFHDGLLSPGSQKLLRLRCSQGERLLHWLH